MTAAPVLASHDAVLLPGERRLVVGAEIGSGTLGTVYAARVEQTIHEGQERDETLAVPAAVKIVDDAFARDAEAMKGLRRAVRYGALVRHPNVIQINDFFTAWGSPCILMEHVPGMSLASLLGRHAAARRRVPLDLALFLACEIAEGLCAARNARGVHGALLNMGHHDLGPRHVLLGYSGEVKVKGFGMHIGGGMTSGVRRAAADVRGPIVHMAPEVASGGRGDGRSDVFSLGVMLHEMLRGPRFQPGLAANEMLDLAGRGVVQRSVIEPLLPAGVAAVIDRALAIEPPARYAHAGVLAYDLRREALALGVGDARAFLRAALLEMGEGLAAEQDTERGCVLEL